MMKILLKSRKIIISRVVWIMCFISIVIFSSSRAVFADGGKSLSLDLAQGISSLAVVADVAYVSTYSAIHQIDLNSGHMTLLKNSTLGEEGGIDYLVSDGQNLVGINSQQGTVYTITFPEEEITFNLIQAFFEDTQEENVFHQGIVQGVLQKDRLFLLMLGYAGYEVYEFNLTIGSHRKLPFEHLEAIAPYESGRLLGIMQKDLREEADQRDNPWLVALTPDNGETERLFEMPFSMAMGLVYEPQEQMIYYCFDHTLYRQNQEMTKPQTVAYLPAHPGGAAFIKNKMYIFTNWKSLYGRSTAPQDLPAKVITIQGILEEEIVQNFSKAYPHIPLVVKNLQEDLQALNIEIISNTGETDIYIVSGAQLKLLMEKGYCLDLSGHETIKAAYDKMYPYVKTAISHHERVMAVPIQVYGGTWVYYKDMWQDLGLKQELPQNFIDLCTFINRWAADYAPSAPNIQLIENVLHYQTFMMEIALETYMDYCTALGQVPDFNEALFRNMVNAAQGVTRELDRETYMEMEENTLFARGYNIFWLDIIRGNIYTPLPLGPGPDIAWKQGVYTTGAFVHPASKNQEDAQIFLAYLLDQTPQEERISLYKDENNPIVERGYEENRKNIEAEMEEVKEDMTMSAASEQGAFKEKLETLQRRWDTNETYKYAIDRNTADWFGNTLVPNLVDAAQAPFAYQSQAGQEIRALYKTFVNGERSFEEFIVKANDKVNMMMNE